MTNDEGSNVYLPLRIETRKALYQEKQGDTWDELFQKMLRAYRADKPRRRRATAKRRKK
jgi:hypothetical protein